MKQCRSYSDNVALLTVLDTKIISYGGGGNFTSQDKLAQFRLGNTNLPVILTSELLGSKVSK